MSSDAVSSNLTVGDTAAVLAAVAAWGTFILAAVATYAAYRQLDLWRLQSNAQQKAQAAVRVFNAANKINDELNSIRVRFTRVPVEKQSDKKYLHERRWERLNEISSDFEELRRAEVTFRFLTGNSHVESAVNSLFDLRNELRCETEDAWSDVDRQQEVDRQEEVRRRRMFFASADAKDEISKRQIEAMNTLERELGPFARMELRK